MIIYKRCYFLFITGGIGYALLEILFRGYTHISMAFAGGLSLISIDLINRCFKAKSIFLRAFFSCLAITVIELLIGIWVNKIHNLNVWDYSEMPLNFQGQICLLFSLLWYVLSLGILMCMNLRAPGKKFIIQKE